MSELNPDHVRWQKNLLASLKVGGVWGVPASGALIEKSGDARVKIKMPGNDAKLLGQIKEHIVAAGYTIEEDVQPTAVTP